MIKISYYKPAISILTAPTFNLIYNALTGADGGFWKGGGGGGGNLIGLQAGGGPALVPMLKNLHRGQKGGGRPLGPPWIRY